MALFPGAPKLLRGNTQSLVVSLAGSLLNAAWDYLFPAPQWGVFIPGTADRAIDVTSVAALDISGEARVSDYIIETGSFVSYNKVAVPDIFAVRVTADGSEADRSLLINWLDTHKRVTTLFDIVCPEHRWPNATLVGYRTSRSARSGASMLTVDCYFQQVRDRPARYVRANIQSSEDEPATQTARVNPQNAEPNSAGGGVEWQ